MSDLEALAQSRVGTVLRGKYHLERVLGVGGMAAVYRATHRVGNRVAVKVLHPHMFNAQNAPPFRWTYRPKSWAS